MDSAVPLACDNHLPVLRLWSIAGRVIMSPVSSAIELYRSLALLHVSVWSLAVEGKDDMMTTSLV